MNVERNHAISLVLVGFHMASDKWWVIIALPIRNKRCNGVSLNADSNCAIALVLGIAGFLIGSKNGA